MDVGELVTRLTRLNPNMEVQVNTKEVYNGIEDLHVEEAENERDLPTVILFTDAE